MRAVKEGEWTGGWEAGNCTKDLVALMGIEAEAIGRTKMDEQWIELADELASTVWERVERVAATPRPTRDDIEVIFTVLVER